MLWVWWHVICGHGRRHPLRLAVQIMAIAIGVALGYGVNLINTAALREFAAAVRQVTGQADATLTGPKAGFDENLYARVAGHPDVEFASPLLEVAVAVRDVAAARPGVLSIIGVDALRAGYFSPALRLQPVDGAARLAMLEDGLYLSAAALEKFQLRPGDALTVQVGARSVKLPVTGTLPGAPSASVLGVMDLGFAQWRLDRLGRLTRIELRLRPGTALDRLAASLALPPGVTLAGAGAATTRMSNLSRAYRVNLNVLALVALFTGAFLVFSLTAQATLARRTEFAYLRVAGVTARQLQALLVGETLLVC